MQVDAKAVLYMVTKEFGLERDTTKDRLILQKTIYLLQAHGLQLGYGFSWYKYGPYSQDLVQDAYAVLRSEEYKFKNETSSWNFSPNSLQEFEKFKGICGDLLGDAASLELLASVDFVKQTWCPKASKQEFITKFRQSKKQLFGRIPITDAMINKALGICKKLRAN